MKDYNNNKEFSYLKHWNANNFYGWTQELLINYF